MTAPEPSDAEVIAWAIVRSPLWVGEVQHDTNGFARRADGIRVWYAPPSAIHLMRRDYAAAHATPEPWMGERVWLEAGERSKKYGVCAWRSLPLESPTRAICTELAERRNAGTPEIDVAEIALDVADRLWPLTGSQPVTRADVLHCVADVLRAALAKGGAK